MPLRKLDAEDADMQQAQAELAPVHKKAAEALALEQQISDLVNAAYGLTPDEVALMWQTAPPRMPLPAPDKTIKLGSGVEC